MSERPTDRNTTATLAQPERQNMDDAYWRKQFPGVPHGRNSTYCKGCKCTLCVAAKTEMNRRYRKSLQGADFRPEAIQKGWEQEGSCRTFPTEIFYPEDEESPRQSAKAKAICASCPVQTSCLEHSLLKREKDGIWGGLTTKERTRLVRQRRRQRYVA